jgi:hypothetical protein
VIEAVPESRASMEATSTSPAAVVAGRRTVSVDPNVEADATAPAEGKPLKAGPDPAIVTPRISANATNGR